MADTINAPIKIESAEVTTLLRTALLLSFLIICLLIFKAPITQLMESFAQVFTTQNQNATFTLGKQGFTITKQSVENAQQEVTALEAELKTLKEQLASKNVDKQQLAENVTAMQQRAASATQNISQELQNIQTVETAATNNTLLPIETSTEIQASQYEQQGFRALLNQDFNSALDNFKQAENAKSGYHSVFEIQKLLSFQQAVLKTHPKAAQSPIFWRAIYRVVLANHSFGMPAGIKSEFQAKLN